MEPVTPFPRLVGKQETAPINIPGLTVNLEVPEEIRQVLERLSQEVRDLRSQLGELQNLRAQQEKTNTLLAQLLNKPAPKQVRMKRVLVRDENGRATHAVEEPM